MKHYSLFIDGHDTDAVSGERIEMVDPSTGDTFATIARGGRRDIDIAVASAKKALNGP